MDLRTWRLRVDGHVERPLELSMGDLHRMEAVSVVAVNQCPGNSRSFFEPRVPGGQWLNGAMGNARWTGVRLRDLLQRAGLRAGAVAPRAKHQRVVLEIPAAWPDAVADNT
ncbi:MAG: sorA [Gemmataceae bacterium]|nr:sorA [Gemmataceae bacterium]